MLNSNLFSTKTNLPNHIDFRTEFDSSIFKEFGPHSNSKCFTDEKRKEYIEKLLVADISRELPKQLRGFSLGDAHTNWEPAEWRFRSKSVDKIHLWTKKTFSSSAKNLGIIRRIVVLEEFFDLIKSLHERPNKDGYNGQKKLFNMIKNRYACLPRDAVDKYITMWRKATTQLSSYEHDRDGVNSRKTLITAIPGLAPITGISSSSTTTAMSTMAADLTMQTNSVNKDFHTKTNSVINSKMSIDSMNKFSGISMVYHPQAQSDHKLTHSPLANIKYQFENGENKLLSNDLQVGYFSNSAHKPDSSSSNQGSMKENSFENDDIIPNKRIKLEDGDSETNTENEEILDENSSPTTCDPIQKMNGLKKPTDIDMAYNIFVRKLIDSTLDRTITFCEQPKLLISSLENICAEAFQSFDKSRHRIKIRGYLKACRRNSKKHNGKVSMKDTPSHMCSDKACTIANEAFQKVEKEIENLILPIILKCASFATQRMAKPGKSDINQFFLSKPQEIDKSKTDAQYLDYIESAMSSTSLEPQYPNSSNTAWADNEHFSSMLANFLPSLYGMIPLPPLLTLNVSGVSGDGVSPPPAHINPHFNSIPSSLFYVMDGCSLYSATSQILEKMLHCNSIDPDFGMQLLLNRSASQEAINCMRITARYLLSRSLMMESFLIKESTKLDILSEEKN